MMSIEKCVEVLNISLKVNDAFYKMQDNAGLKFTEGRLKYREDVKQAVSLAIQILSRLNDEHRLPDKDIGKIIMFIRRSMFLPENTKMEELSKMITKALIQALTKEEPKK
jgi:uncharacterized protein YjaG (DUF416 family)